jgi:hypothetical protein
MSAHTPGPWQQYNTEVIAINARGIATKIAALHEPPVPYSASVMDANGALLAAAPELLVALRDTLATLEALSAKHRDGMSNLVGTTVYNARAAIAKAEGRT